MASFSKIHDWLFNWEGGYQNMKNDSGNYDSAGRLIGTKYGIAAITYEQYLWDTKRQKLTDLPQSEAIKIMKTLTKSQAIKIGKVLFWDKIRGDEIKNQSVAEVIFQWYWGSPANGIWRSKAAISGFVKGVSSGNTMSKEDVKAINRYGNQKKIFNAIKQAQYDWYDSLNNPDFEAGWLSRVSSMEFKLGGNNKTIPFIFAGLAITGIAVYLITRKKR